MQSKAALSGLVNYASHLLAAIIFPLQWKKMHDVAKRHTDVDARGPQKVLAAGVAGLLLAGLGVYMVADFQAGATEGIYNTLDGRLSAAVGNDQYNAHVEAASQAQDRVDLANRKIAEGEDRALWEANREAAEAERDEELAAAAALRPNAILYEALQPFVLAQDDANAKKVIAERGAIDFPGLDASTEAAFAKKDAAVSDMNSFLWWFVWPGIAGVLFAPITFTVSKVLQKAFIPSEGVGYKPYPGGAMALFLLFGGFGIPALFFAAWTFSDMQSRSEIGQITL